MFVNYLVYMTIDDGWIWVTSSFLPLEKQNKKSNFLFLMQTLAQHAHAQGTLIQDSIGFIF